jgi:maltooligosyltrehalose trehalohydrolase
MDKSMTWQPSLGAWPEGDGTRFRVWAPLACTVEVIGEGRASHALQKAPDGTFGGLVPGVGAGDRYRYRVDGKGPYPDPASRFQPEGVHGPSEVVDAGRFEWSDASWRGISLDDLVIYELHVGTFTPAGSFAAARDYLPRLMELGVTALELMPVADFPGRRNWGYDGVDLFAPARCYGRPDDLRRLVDSAHRLGLAVLLDVVYNHLGPDGNYLGVYSPYYFSKRHSTAWGAGLNFDGEHSAMVRGFFIENALHWIHEYHLDGLRLDATHAMKDDGPRHFLAELSANVSASAAGRPVHLIAEDHRNLAAMLRPENTGGWGLDAVWADDFHHQLRRHLTGDSEGYYRDFSGSSADLAATMRQGWFYCGQHSVHHNQPRGTDPGDLLPRQLVWCLQNHDQIGNRALGERLHHQINLAAYRAATALLLCSPATPLLFMGQEWAAGTPFLFFTDHDRELGRRVTEGRRQEFKSFSAFSDPHARECIPDPQAESTFLASKLNWAEAEQEPYAATRRLYQALLHLRRTEPALQRASRTSYAAVACAESGILLLRTASSGPAVLLVVQLWEEGTLDVRNHDSQPAARGRRWQTVLTTEDPPFSPDACPPQTDLSGPAPVVRFLRPGAVILREVLTAT